MPAVSARAAADSCNALSQSRANIGQIWDSVGSRLSTLTLITCFYKLSYKVRREHLPEMQGLTLHVLPVFTDTPNLKAWQ